VLNYRFICAEIYVELLLIFVYFFEKKNEALIQKRGIFPKQQNVSFCKIQDFQK